MVGKKKIWSIMTLGLVASIWKMYTSVYTSSVSSSYSPEEQPFTYSLLERRPCNCNRCLDHTNQNWFCDNFDGSVSCLLTPETQQISPTILHWWLKLQRSQDGSQVQEIMKHLFDILPSLTDRVQDLAQCGTCAVVGNSGRLRGSKYGEKIDSHQFVLRINTAPTKGFEVDVGTRTTHRFIYPESAVNLSPGSHLVLLPFKPLDLKWLASIFSSGDIKYTYKRVRQFIEADKSKVLIIHPGFLKYIQDKWTKQHGRYPSTGFTALIFAIHICTQVSAFGFGADNNGDWHHYWEENHYAGAFRKTRVHDGDFEFGLIKRLAAEGKVLFYS
ncbi:CMP-N-acetylneuraminate-beta-galactosamide-alpha-2,3-sialyltransferase 2 [Pogona vitticeps]